MAAPPGGLVDPMGGGGPQFTEIARPFGGGRAAGPRLRVDELFQHFLEVGERVGDRGSGAGMADGDVGGGEVREFEDQVEELALIAVEGRPDHVRPERPVR